MSFEPLLSLNDLAKLLGRSPDTIKKDLRRNPCAVPPRLIFPNTRMLRWRACDVERWLESFAKASSSEIEGGLK